MLPKSLLEILVCPRCRAKVTQNGTGTAVICRPCGVQYPVRGQAPILLLNQASPIGEGK